MKTLIVNHTKKNIIITKSFNKKASVYGSAEYETMKDLRIDFPDYKVNVKEIKKNPNKKSYANLTYANMKLYIKQIEGAEAENLKCIKGVVEASKIQPSPYAYVKKWFLENYPNYRDPNTNVEEAAENLNDTAA